MRSEKERQEVWKNNRLYMDDESTTEDLLKCCQLCVKKEGLCNESDPEKWCIHKESCPIFQLWLSNEYGEWCDSWS